MRQPISAVALLLLGLARKAQSRVGVTKKPSDADQGDTVDLIIRYRNKDGANRVAKKASKIKKKFKRVDAIAATVKRTEKTELENDPDIAYVEFDEPLWQDDVTFLTYGIHAIQGDFRPTDAVQTPSELSGSCHDDNSFKVAILDDGIDVSHPDLCGDIKDKKKSWCKGVSFTKGKWSSPKTGHGTHVAGTIAGTGIYPGVVNDGSLCLLVAKVFDDSGHTSTSTVLEAIEWAVEEGADIINMSLGGSQPSKTFFNEILKAHNSGTIIVASAGNEGGSFAQYPASYPHTISVGAVDDKMQQAHFSNSAPTLDIVAPGVDILSTVPVGAGTAGQLVVEGGQHLASHFFVSSEYPTKGITGSLVYCGLATSTCPGSGGHICLIQRGEIKFAEKASFCEASGASAAIIYNNEEGAFRGSLGEAHGIKIPVLGVSLDAGERLLPFLETADVELARNYEYSFLDGTSMATPHVTGALAKVWRHCRQCSNEDVVQCMETSATDLGPNGWDTSYGYGLIQMKYTFICLVQLGCCEANEDFLASLVTPAPSAAPSEDNSLPPSDMPSSEPSTVA